MSGRLRRAVLAACVVVVALAAGAGVWRVALRERATPIALPAARRLHGALVYATAGFERIELLGGRRHSYPGRTVLVVARSRCGLTLTWRPLVERRESWRLCRAGGGVRLAGFDELHTFLGRPDRRTYRCSTGSTWLPAGPRAGRRFGWACRSGGTTETGRGRVLDAAGSLVHVRVTTVLSGGTRGSGLRELWLRRDGVPVRALVENDNRSRSAIGDVRYRERYELRH